MVRTTIPKAAGTYTVRFKNGQVRRVQRLANGRIKFLKSTGARASPARRRSSGSSSRRRAPAKRRTRRKTPVARKKTSRRRSGSKTLHLLPWLAGANAVVQMVEPYVERNLHGALANGQWTAAMNRFKAGTKEAVSVKNLAQALVPVGAVSVARMAKETVGAPNPSLKLGGRRKIAVF